MDINLTNPVTTAKIGEVVNGASAATPNDTDLLPVIESSVTKKLTLTNLKAFLKTYFDTLYSNLGYTAENVANKSSSYTLSSTTTYANTKALVDGLATKEPLKGSDDNYVTDAQLVVIGNTSGTNSGDNATNTTSNTYADGKITQVITNGVTDKAPSEDAVFDALALKASLTGVETLTNKRITRRVTSIVSSATPTVNTDSCDMVRITAQAANITSMTSGLSGTPTEGQLLHYQMLAAVAYTIAWEASFEAKGQALPTVFTANKRLNVLFSWDSVTAKWGCLDAIVEA